MTTSGLEQIKYPIKKNLTCEQQMIEWRDANATYHGSRNADPRQQGWYTKKGDLWVGHICEN